MEERVWNLGEAKNDEKKEDECPCCGFPKEGWMCANCGYEFRCRNC